MQNSAIHGFEREIIYEVSDKSHGNMSFKYGPRDEVIKNRQNFLSATGIDLNNCVVMGVNDEDIVLKVDSSMKGRGATNRDTMVAADALITQDYDLVLFLFTADCCPIAYYDPITQSIALAHLGWRSTQRKLASKVVIALNTLCGSNAKDLRVLIGPSVRKDSYKFLHPEQKEIAEWIPFLEDTDTGETKIDLVGFNRAQLLQAGVNAKNIIIDSHDTIMSDMYYSHYRSIRTAEPEGRFATVVGLRRN